MPKMDLRKYGITRVKEVIYNPTYEVLFNEETRPELTGFDRGQETELGAVNVMTGVYTGRSPKDKFIVMDENSKDTVWWTTPEFPNDNRPLSKKSWRESARKLHRNNFRASVCSWSTASAARTGQPHEGAFHHGVAWQAHFVTNMFIRPKSQEDFEQEPDFVVYNASKAKVDNYRNSASAPRLPSFSTLHQRAGHPEHLVRR